MDGNKLKPCNASKITILCLLKNFYDNEAFITVIRELYNSNEAVSLAAIKASALIGNETAIPHLYKVIEKGTQQQTIEGIKALADIKAPSTIPRLLEYYNFFRKEDIQLEILKALHIIDPLHKKIIDLHKQVLRNTAGDDTQKIFAAQALVDAEEFTFLRIHIVTLSPKIFEAVFLKILESESEEVPGFLWSFREEANRFLPSTLGCFLAAYQATSRQPKQSFVLEHLRGSDRRTLISFLLSIVKYGERIAQPLRIFRTLLIIPYMNKKTEAVTGDSLEKLIYKIEETSAYHLSEMAMITRTHLDSVLSKVKRNYLSRKHDEDKETLLMKIFAHLLENYGNAKLVKEVKDFFKSNNHDQMELSSLVTHIEKQCGSAGKEEQKILKACFPLLEIHDTTARLKMLSFLKQINLMRPFLLRRLNRLIRVTGVLGMKSSVKKILEVLDFAREERISFLEETSVVTLCQLFHRGTVEQADRYLKNNVSPSFKGYIRGAGYMQPEYIVTPLLDLLSQPILSMDLRDIIIKSIERMRHRLSKSDCTRLLSLINMKQNPPPLKKRIGDLIIETADISFFAPFLDLTYHTDECIQHIGLKGIRKIIRSGIQIPREILVNRLYILMDETSNTFKREVLLTLICLEDDYALQAFKDYIINNNEEIVADIIGQLEPPLSHDVITLLFSLIWKESEYIHTALRRTIGKLSSGDYAEEIRNTLLEFMRPGKEVPPPLENEIVYSEKDNIIGHAKKEYKFKRENSQVITVFFIDMVGYTEKSSEKDTTSLMDLIGGFEEIVIPVIREYKGDIVKKMGDGILAVFKNPLNAAFASLMIQDEIKKKNVYTVEKEKFEVRIGLNTGEVIRKDGDVFGDVVNVASRMETAANPGDILLTQSTFNEIKEYIQCTQLGNINVKGKKEAITTYSAQKVMTNTSHILKKSRQKLDKYTKSNRKNPLTVLKESMFTPDFSFSDTIEEGRDILRRVSTMLRDITELSAEITHDYYDEYTFKRYVQEQWDALLDTLPQKELETEPIDE